MSEVICPHCNKAFTIDENDYAKLIAPVQKQLMIVQNQQANLTKFENNIETFKNSFLYTYENATKKHKEAIDGIDKAIAQRTKIKEALQTSDKHINAANNKLTTDLTIKRLTQNADSIYDKLVEIRKENSD